MGEARSPARDIALLALGLTVLRLIAAGTLPLTEDEAYYRLWAQHLQLGYLDHPPMIAWWIRAGETFFGDTPLGVRLIPTLASGATTWLIGDLAQRLGASSRTALRAALWYNATVTVCIGGMLAIPDAPASFFWTITLCALARIREPRGAAWWLTAGVAAGLAVISKYSGLFLAPGVLLWLLLTPGGTAELRKPWPWAAAVAAVAVFSVNVAWNAQHHWLTFAKQFGRATPHGITPGHLVDLIGTQILLFTPPLAIYAALGVRQAWRERADSAAVQLMLPVAASAPFAAYLLIHSLHDRVQGHWPAPLFGALAVCAAAAAERFDGTGALRTLRRLAPVAGFAVGAAAFALAALPSPSPFGARDPTQALRGWPQFARDIDALRLRTGAAWVGAESYGSYAQLNNARQITAPLAEVVERDRYWADDPGRPDYARPGLVVDLSRRMKVPDVERCFTHVSVAGDLKRDGGLHHNQRYTAFLVSGPKRDPWIIGCPDEIRPGVWR